MKEERKGFGCFTYPTIVLMAIICGSTFRFIIPIPGWLSITAFLFLFSWVVGKMINHNRFPQRYTFYSDLFLSILLAIRFVLNLDIPAYSPKYELADTITKERVLEKGDSITLLSQDRNWKDNYGNGYSGHFSVREQDYKDSKDLYWRLSNTKGWKSWSELYQYLITQDTPYLDLIIEELTQIQQTKQLDQFEFAEMVVTFIQDIPYALVFEGRCSDSSHHTPETQRVLDACPECCIGFIPNGVQTPIAFMGDLKGDCDTRTVIIYAILNYFGYDVAILNSNYYRHSILGLHIPSTGTYKLHNGKRYYVWETTNKNYTLGNIPKNYRRMNYWDVVLSNEL